MLCHFTPSISDGSVKGRVVPICDCCHIAMVLERANELIKHVYRVVPSSTDDLVKAVDLD